jgi:cob(I)alamin adenosyltransferase
VVILNRIYTRAGDEGLTRLADGAQVSKSSGRVSAYGEVDELNAVIGLVRLETAQDSILDPILARIQNDLFDLGADLATPVAVDGPLALRIVSSQVERLEQEIDILNADLSGLTSFVLPGGARAAAALHLARTVCRRAERVTTAFVDSLSPLETTRPHDLALRYLNRLSDLMFVAARFANRRGQDDVLWVPAANR